eukprot:16275-Rhodomonas_salina.2
MANRGEKPTKEAGSRGNDSIQRTSRQEFDATEQGREVGREQRSTSAATASVGLARRGSESEDAEAEGAQRAGERAEGG